MLHEPNLGTHTSPISQHNSHGARPRQLFKEEPHCSSLQVMGSCTTTYQLALHWLTTLLLPADSELPEISAMSHILLSSDLCKNYVVENLTLPQMRSVVAITF